ncbi:MAG: hypothetical protein KJ622_02080 [Alphaproteobacteria bacterium]|nr:hypothetical protein [Alphaproteobacteria bacterium]
MVRVSQIAGLFVFTLLASLSGGPAPGYAGQKPDCAKEDDAGNRTRCERFALATELFQECMTAGRNLSEIKPSAYEGRLDLVPGNEGELRFQNQKLGIAMRIQKNECTVFALSEKPADLIKLFDPIEEDIRQQYPKAEIRKRQNGTNWLAFEPSANDLRYVTAGKQKISEQDFALLLYQFD